MDSTPPINPNPVQDETEETEKPKHKIWSPIPRKLLKVENGDSSIKALDATNNDDSPISTQNNKCILKNFNPKASAFKKLFSDQNGNGNGNGNGTGNTIFNIPKLSNTQSLFSNSDTGSALTADTISDKNNPFASQQDGSTSIFYRNVPKFTLNTEPGSPFGKPSNETVTPKFRINLSELSGNVRRNPFADFLLQPQEPLSQAFLADGYSKLLSNLIKTDTDREQSAEDKAEQKHNDNCSRNNNNENGNQKMANFLKPNITKKKSRHCNCRNSKCLKLYCECLAYGEYCDDRCNCCDCHNNTQKAESRNYALSIIMEKKPEILEMAPLKKQNSSKIVRGKGCNCKKSACLKKYCECFNSGLGCGPSCKCDGCKNPHAKVEGLESIKSTELNSPISPDLIDGLGLSLKEKSFSEMDPHLINQRKERNLPALPLLNRGISEKSTGAIPALSLLSFGGGL